jgi:hypothetical protein
MKEKYEVLKFDEYEKAGGKGSYDKGVLSATLSKWDEFYGELKRFRNYKDYVWRGQRRGYPEWKLQSKFDRQPSNEKEREKIREEHLDQFKKAIRGRRGTNPPELKDDEFWALGQHYGLVTPFLDWTESPFVAAYFAFIKEVDDAKQSESKRVIYGLNRDIERWYQSTNIYRGGRQTSMADYFIKFPQIETHENVRFLAQACVSTDSLKGQDIKYWVQECYNERRHKKRIILVEISIGDSEREECLRDLSMMNINHASLFPDIEGAAKFCNLKMEIDKQ